eukprot:jgi/Bigna1/66261/fgenesh1_pg.1_\
MAFTFKVIHKTVNSKHKRQAYSTPPSVRLRRKITGVLVEKAGPNRHVDTDRVNDDDAPRHHCRMAALCHWGRPDLHSVPDSQILSHSFFQVKGQDSVSDEHRCPTLTPNAPLIVSLVRVITGGSQGIGKCIAEKFVADGANVVIMARTEAKLKLAVEELKTKATGGDSQKIEYRSVDVTDVKALKETMEGLKQAIIFWSKTSLSSGSRSVKIHKGGSYFVLELNYFGSLHTAKVVAPMMVARGTGHIVFTSSAAAFAPVIGYSQYAPSKAAIGALAGCLRNELSGAGIRISIAHPPDTESPGYDYEMKIKPKECKELSSWADVYKAEDVANDIVTGIKAGDYHIATSDFLLNRVVQGLGAGITPRTTYLLDLLLTPIWAIVAEVFLHIEDYYAYGYGQSLVKGLKKEKNL